MEGKEEVKKNTITKTVEIGRNIMGYCNGNEWKWTAAAQKRYTVEQLDLAKSVAERS